MRRTKKAAHISLGLTDGRVEIILSDGKNVLAYHRSDIAEAKQIVKDLKSLIRLSDVVDNY